MTPIEFISTFLVRPFSLAVRLFANMLAGHILLVTFAVLSSTLCHRRAGWLADPAVLPFFMLVVLTGFEIMVRSCRPTSSRSSPPCTSAARMHPEH